MGFRIAVVTDAVSPDFIFPIWHRYYGSLFGESNLFVVTYKWIGPSFKEFGLGGLIELPVGYNDNNRRAVISQLVSTLLPCYDSVIRVDADEFLVVDPRVAPSLDVFIKSMKAPYLTARGFDVLQMPDEPPVSANASGSILKDRAFAYPNTALNKTCVVTIPVDWSEGFHWASVPPKFGPLFMLHMKRLDIGWQLAWCRQMTESLQNNNQAEAGLHQYYSPDEQRVLDYHKGAANRPFVAGIDSWYRDTLIAKFLEGIALVSSTGLYHGEYGHEQVLCEIPPEWRSII